MQSGISCPLRAGAPRTLRARRTGAWRWHLAAPVIVALTLAGLLLATAGDALRPAREVLVRPVLFGAEGGGLTRGSEQKSGAGRHGGGSVGSGGVQAPGWLEASPFNHACSALTDGVIEDVLVLAGDRVERGQVVARLVPDDARLALRAAEAELREAHADLAAAKADLDAARTRWENPIERERAVGVSRARLAEIQAELAQLPSLIEAERATADRLREESKRAREAQQRGAATEIEVIIQAKRAAAQEASLAALLAREAILLAQRDRLRAEVEAAERNADLRIEERHMLDRARAGVSRAEARVARLEARRDDAALRLERMSVRSPIDGYVQRRAKAPGDKVIVVSENAHSAHVAYVYDPRSLQVRVDVPLADAAKVRVGQACDVVVEVLPERTFAGEVVRITHEADLQKNTLEVHVKLEDPAPLLRPEMLTRVKFLASGRDGALGAAPVGPGAFTRGGVRIAEECLDRRGDEARARVWVIRDRRNDLGRATPVEVAIESVSDGWAVVRGDLRPGDLAAASPRDLTPGVRVRMRTPSEGGA